MAAIRVAVTSIVRVVRADGNSGIMGWGLSWKVIVVPSVEATIVPETCVP